MIQHSHWRSPFTKFFPLSTHRCLGNVTPVNREPLQITFNPFRENRLSVTVRVTDPSQPPTCRLAFLKEPRKDRVGNVRTICNLSIDLSEEVRQENSYLIDVGRLWEPQNVKYVTKFLAPFHDSWTVHFFNRKFVCEITILLFLMFFAPFWYRTWRKVTQLLDFPVS